MSYSDDDDGPRHVQGAGPQGGDEDDGSLVIDETAQSTSAAALEETQQQPPQARFLDASPSVDAFAAPRARPADDSHDHEEVAGSGIPPSSAAPGAAAAAAAASSSSSSLGVQPSSPASPTNSKGRQSTAPVIARSVGTPLHVCWVTCSRLDGSNNTNNGEEIPTSTTPFPNFVVRTGIKLGDIAAPETTFAVARSVYDLLQFRTAFCQAKPYVYIGELPPADSLKHDADEILAFIHIVVNNPVLCDLVLTWHLLTIPQPELGAIQLPGAMSVIRSSIFKGGPIFGGPPEIPRDDQLKVEVFCPAWDEWDAAREELFAALDLVGDACTAARGFQYSKDKFAQRAAAWDALRRSILEMEKRHGELNDASCAFEAGLRDLACSGALFWPWTTEQTLADERLKQQMRQKQQKQADDILVGANSNSNSSAPLPLPSSPASAEAQSSPDLAASRGLESSKPHPSVLLGKAFLSTTNLTEATAKQTSALDLQNLITVVTLMTKVDVACATSSGLADEYFRQSSEELQTLVTLLKEIKSLAAAAKPTQQQETRQRIKAIGEAAVLVAQRVRQMQADLRAQMQSVRENTHGAVAQELERWTTAQFYTWQGTVVLAKQVQQRLQAELGATDTYAESLPMTTVTAGASGGSGGAAAAAAARKPVSFGPPVLEDLSMAFNLTSLPSRGGAPVRRRALQVSDEAGFPGGGFAQAELRKIMPQPRRERQVKDSHAAKLASLDDPFARN